MKWTWQCYGNHDGEESLCILCKFSTECLKQAKSIWDKLEITDV